MKLPAHRLGAVFYLLWGVLHVLGGTAIMTADAQMQVAMFGTAAGVDAPDPGAVVHAALSFHAFNLLWMGLLSATIAVLLNWKNSVTGYWLNLTIVGAADIGLILFLLIPGHMAVADGMPGPVLWVLAVVFSTIGLRSNSAKSL